MDVVCTIANKINRSPRRTSEVISMEQRKLKEERVNTIQNHNTMLVMENKKNTVLK